MVHHIWGEEGVDWAGIDAAASYIGRYLRKWGRVSVTQTKEKFGTARVYCSFGWYQLHSITHPGYVRSRYPKWLWEIDCLYIAKILPRLTDWAVGPYHKWLYRRAYKLALRKWPHLAAEILMGADWTELLMGLDSRLLRTETAPNCWTIEWVDPLVSRKQPESEDE